MTNKYSHNYSIDDYTTEEASQLKFTMFNVFQINMKYIEEMTAKHGKSDSSFRDSLKLDDINFDALKFEDESINQNILFWGTIYCPNFISKDVMPRSFYAFDAKHPLMNGNKTMFNEHDFCMDADTFESMVLAQCSWYDSMGDKNTKTKFIGRGIFNLEHLGCYNIQGDSHYTVDVLFNSIENCDVVVDIDDSNVVGMDGKNPFVMSELSNADTRIEKIHKYSITNPAVINLRTIKHETKQVNAHDYQIMRTSFVE